ncbi:unnamed protein product [Coccothraustes coccothraustes]
MAVRARYEGVGRRGKGAGWDGALRVRRKGRRELFQTGKKEVHLIQKTNHDVAAERQDITLNEKDLWVLSDFGFVC